MNGMKNMEYVDFDNVIKYYCCLRKLFLLNVFTACSAVVLLSGQSIFAAFVIVGNWFTKASNFASSVDYLYIFQVCVEFMAKLWKEAITKIMLIKDVRNLTKDAFTRDAFVNYVMHVYATLVIKLHKSLTILSKINVRQPLQQSYERVQKALSSLAAHPTSTLSFAKITKYASTIPLDCKLLLVFSAYGFVVSAVLHAVAVFNHSNRESRGGGGSDGGSNGYSNGYSNGRNDGTVSKVISLRNSYDGRLWFEDNNMGGFVGNVHHRGANWRRDGGDGGGYADGGVGELNNGNELNSINKNNNNNNKKNNNNNNGGRLNIGSSMMTSMNSMHNNKYYKSYTTLTAGLPILIYYLVTSNASSAPAPPSAAPPLTARRTLAHCAVLLIYAATSSKCVIGCFECLGDLVGYGDYRKKSGLVYKYIRNMRKVYYRNYSGSSSSSSNKALLSNIDNGIKLESLSAGYIGTERKWAVYNIDMHVKPGQIYAVRGHGKTSLFRTLGTGVYGDDNSNVRIVGGNINLFGTDFNEWDEGIKRNVCSLTLNSGVREIEWLYANANAFVPNTIYNIITAAGAGATATTSATASSAAAAADNTNADHDNAVIDGRVLKACAGLCDGESIVRTMGNKIITKDTGLSQSQLVKIVLMRKVYGLMVGLHGRDNRPKYFNDSLYGSAIFIDGLLDALPTEDARIITDNLRKSKAVVILGSNRDDIAGMSDAVGVVEEGELRAV
jgi:hypothetical protein